MFPRRHVREILFSKCPKQILVLKSKFRFQERIFSIAIAIYSESNSNSISNTVKLFWFFVIEYVCSLGPSQTFVLCRVELDYFIVIIRILLKWFISTQHNTTVRLDPCSHVMCLDSSTSNTLKTTNYLFQMILWVSYLFTSVQSVRRFLIRLFLKESYIHTQNDWSTIFVNNKLYWK